MLDRAEAGTGVLRATRQAPLPVAEMIIGKQVEEAAALLPRLFNLCRTAQELAARLAFGLPMRAEAQTTLSEEIPRDHLIKFFLKWPGYFGQPAIRLPQEWQADSTELRRALFGAEGGMPGTPEDFDRFIGGDTYVASVLRRIGKFFAPGEAVTPVLPNVSPETALSSDCLENSVAGRHAPHPVMMNVENSTGRGPYWRAVGRAYDIEACLGGMLPDPCTTEEGAAMVPAARGTYAVRAAVSDGIVTFFQRVTPTDHLLAEGGILEQALATLPPEKAGLAPFLMDILDPCHPVKLEEVAHA